MIRKQGLVTVGLGSHHAEALPFLREQMERHETIVLEEPSVPDFQTMLNDHLSVDEYLLQIDSEFPQFDRLMCGLLKEFHGMGRCILQVEPYLETLIEIHELFAAGKLPLDVMNSVKHKRVYEVERNATGALISYYTSSVRDTFPKVVKAVKTFARPDARRLLLRDQLRAHAIASMAGPGNSIFVEDSPRFFAGARHQKTQGETSQSRSWRSIDPAVLVPSPSQPVSDGSAGSQKSDLHQAPQ
jgi:hypothetical protein